MYDWRLFHFAITNRSLYVLGAGASFPTISSFQVSDQIRKRIWSNGIFEASPQPTSPLKDRLLQPNENYDIDAFVSGSISQNELASLTSASVVEALFAQTITVPCAQRTSQYAVFDYFHASMLFNFNNDNLACELNPRHLCLRPHGIVEARIAHSPAINRAIQWLAIPDNFRKKLIYHRPLPEPGDITSRIPYRILASQFQSLQVVVIIGYSFGEQRETGSIDDSESFEIIVDLLRWRPKPVLLVGPEPERLLSRIESAIRSKSVSMLRCKWNVLAEFILSGGFTSAYKLARLNGVQEMTSLYLKFEDAM